MSYVINKRLCVVDVCFFWTYFWSIDLTVPFRSPFWKALKGLTTTVWFSLAVNCCGWAMIGLFPPVLLPSVTVATQFRSCPVEQFWGSFSGLPDFPFLWWWIPVAQWLMPLQRIRGFLKVLAAGLCAWPPKITAQLWDCDRCGVLHPHA